MEVVRDLSKIDLAFVLDCTGSMSSYIQNAKTNINKIYDEIIKSEKCHLRLGLVNYRDHPPQDSTYITETYDLTDEIAEAKKFISQSSASGGGDCPEAICCGLYESLHKLTWRDDSVKIVILIADAPPHGIGCPLKNDPVEIAHKMAEKGITLYCAGCEPGLAAYRHFFIALTLITGGQYLPLDSAENLTDLIIGGTNKEVSMEKLMAQVHNDLMKEAAEKGTRVNEEELTKRIQQLINSKDNAEPNLKIQSSIKITEESKELSKLKNLDEIRKYSKENNISLAHLSTLPKTTTFIGRGKPARKSTIKISKILRKPAVVKKISKKTTKKTRSIYLRRSLRLMKSDLFGSTLESCVKYDLRSKKQQITTEIKVTNAAKRKSDDEMKEKATKKRKSAIDKAEAKEADKNEEKTDDIVLTDSFVADDKIDIDSARRLAKKAIARKKI